MVEKLTAASAQRYWQPNARLVSTPNTVSLPLTNPTRRPSKATSLDVVPGSMHCGTATGVVVPVTATRTAVVRSVAMNVPAGVHVPTGHVVNGSVAVPPVGLPAASRNDTVDVEVCGPLVQL